ncbi:MAG TPA: lysylphosphatidylglycerol synthase transmembrane domain-containing protein [Solirubrobacteraceae bacterium]|jgi:uncharacterized membrane protein YbhN (UPF0104 family)
MAKPVQEDPAATMPEALSTRNLRARLLQLAGLVVIVAVLLWVSPGLGSLRSRLSHASPGWLVAAAGLELLSALSYVVVFRAVFCARMGWRLSYQIGMAEQAANSLLPAGGAGGLALGAWALRRGGMSAEHIGRRTVAFFLLTSFANVWTLIVFAAAYAVGLIHGDTAPALTYGVAGAGVIGTVVVLSLPAFTGSSHRRPALPAGASRFKRALRGTRDALGDGVRDSVLLLRRRSPGVLIGSFGYMGFDIAVIWACFLAFGHAPSLGVLVVAYLIGQLGGLLPLPGGIGGIEGGLIGAFVVYQVPLADATVAVLAYRVLALWIPAMLGSIAFVQLRKTLQREKAPASICAPLAEPIVVAEIPAGASN